MLAWLRQGPEEANVTSVIEKQVDWQQHNFFSIS
jgi:hypothetical protein